MGGNWYILFMDFVREILRFRARRIWAVVLCTGFILGFVGDAVNAQSKTNDKACGKAYGCAQEECQAFDNSELDSPVSFSDATIECFPSVVKKKDKSFDVWAIVKRPGVLKPITTLYNTHTRETLPIFQFPAIKPALLQHFFRCRGFGETIEMAPQLLESILGAAKQFEATRVTIISGYRSPKFNDALAKKGRRVAMESRHMRGQAVDFRLNSADAAELGKWLNVNFEGGVGTYENDNFVHIDVGPKRSWVGH